MAKQTILVAFIFFAAVEMTAAQEPNAPAAHHETNVTAAAESLGPAAAKAGLNITDATANDLLGALKTAAAHAPGGEAASKGQPVEEANKDGAAAIKTSAAVGALAAGGVVGSLFF